jgi:hypothetical protein
MGTSENVVLENKPILEATIGLDQCQDQYSFLKPLSLRGGKSPRFREFVRKARSACCISRAEAEDVKGFSVGNFTRLTAMSHSQFSANDNAS